MSEHDPTEEIRDLVRAKMDSGEWSVSDALGSLQSVFTLIAINRGVPRETFLAIVAKGFDEGIDTLKEGRGTHER